MCSKYYLALHWLSSTITVQPPHPSNQLPRNGATLECTIALSASVGDVVSGPQVNLGLPQLIQVPGLLK